jgi:hypothetical protein
MMMKNKIDYILNNDMKVDDATILDVEINRSNRIIFKIESLLYAALGFVVGLPFLIISLGINCIKWVWYDIVVNGVVFIWDCALHPIFKWLGNAIIAVGSLIIKGIGYIFTQFIRLFKYVWYLYKHINWCLFRSISRLITIFGTIISLGFIIKGYLTYSPNVIITGKFMDVNPDIVILHILMVYVLLNIVIFYFLWFLAPEDEVKTVCKYTKDWSKLPSDLSKR